MSGMFRNHTFVFDAVVPSNRLNKLDCSVRGLLAAIDRTAITHTHTHTIHVFLRVFSNRSINTARTDQIESSREGGISLSIATSIHSHEHTYT